MNHSKMEWLADWLSLGVGWPGLFWVRTTPARKEAMPGPAVSPENSRIAA